jgi:uncharacterized metal-binding protein YceD (DUF177 family)
MSEPPEFSRLVNATSLPRAGLAIDLSASAAECAALATRFGVPAISGLTARLSVRAALDGRIRVAGRIRASVVQVCVVSLEPFSAPLDVPYACMFVRQDRLDQAPDGPLDPDAIDEEGFEGTAFDLGESVAQALSLALDPWPRAPGAVADLPEATPDDAEADAPPPASPFAVLARRPRN